MKQSKLNVQVYTQAKGIALVARLESIRLLLAVTYAKNFTLQQMEVKSAFLNGFLQEKAYVERPKNFVNP
jgi:hypothetical protein